jgi:hypothetical protein
MDKRSDMPGYLYMMLDFQGNYIYGPCDFQDVCEQDDFSKETIQGPLKACPCT